MEIKIIKSKISRKELGSLVESGFIKGVVDVGKEIIALGGELHSDAEQILLNENSKQEDLWGFNIDLNKTPRQVEYISLINVRSAQDNPKMKIVNPEIKEQVEKVIKKLMPFLKV